MTKRGGRFTGFRRGLAAFFAAFAVALAVAAPAPAADKLTVLLDWFVNPDHAPLIVAREGGYFARQNLDVELIAPADASAPPRLVAAGKADIAVTYQPDLMLHVDAGLPLVRIGTLVGSPLSSMIALRGGPVKRLADLKGRKIGYSVPGFQEVYLAEMLATAGLTMADVTAINLNFNLVSALMAGQVDAVVGAFRNVEPVELRLHGKAPLIFVPEKNGVPPYEELIYVARNEMRGDPRLPRFLAALREATAWLAANPTAAQKLMAGAHREMDEPINRRSFAATLKLFTLDPAALDRARYESFAAWFHAKGLIKAIPPLESYAIELR